MIPEERELTAKLADQPFTLLGINSDQSRSAFKSILQEQKITWPNIYDGRAGDGPLACQWNVYSWPNIFVLDHEGIIRYRHVSGGSLEEMVRELLKKVPKT